MICARRLLPIVLLATALLAPGAAGAAERTVSVTADATVKVPNDSAALGLSVSMERRSRGAALRAVSSKLQGVISAVQKVAGIGAGDVTTGRVSVHRSFRGRKAVYRASEGIGVILHQPDNAGELVSAAIAAGATGISGPRFFVGDTEAAATKVLVAAFEKAKARAAALASAAGATLGPVIAIDEGEGAEFLPGATGKSAPATDCGSSGPVKVALPRCTTAPPPTKPGTSTVTATVHVVFGLQ